MRFPHQKKMSPRCFFTPSRSSPSNHITTSSVSSIDVVVFEMYHKHASTNTQTHMACITFFLRHTAFDEISKKLPFISQNKSRYRHQPFINRWHFMSSRWWNSHLTWPRSPIKMGSALRTSHVLGHHNGRTRDKHG